MARSVLRTRQCALRLCPCSHEPCARLLEPILRAAVSTIRLVSCRLLPLCHLDGGAEATSAAKSQSIREVDGDALHVRIASIACRLVTYVDALLRCCSRAI